MLLFLEKKLPRIINIPAIATKVAPLCSVYKAPPNDLKVSLAAPASEKVVYFSMLFILELQGRPAKE